MDSCHPKRDRQARQWSVSEVLKAGLLRRSNRLPSHHWKTLNAILCCRTERFGGHVYHCNDCNKEHFVPHSCRNRHCPNCQKTAAVDWLEKQSACLLPVPYFHVVFTLPHELNPLITQNQRVLYNLLFSAASSTLLKFGQERLKAQIGVTAVLHTWSQTLLNHYHLHCIVTGGGLATGEWKNANANYLFPVKALSKVFRAKFRDGLNRVYSDGKLAFHGQIKALCKPEEFNNLLTDALRNDWVVYCKKPFAGPAAVLAYLSRYTHRVAIGNGRILNLDAATGKVTFAYKDYARGSRSKTMTLEVEEFARRFCLHILPERFVKIRHYGLLGNHKRAEKVQQARALIDEDKGAVCLDLQDVAESQSSKNPTGAPAYAPRNCPHCGSTNLSFCGRREPLAKRTVVCDSS